MNETRASCKFSSLDFTRVTWLCVHHYHTWLCVHHCHLAMSSPLSPGYDFTPVTWLWFHTCHLFTPVTWLWFHPCHLSMISPLSPGSDFTPVTWLWFHPCHLAMISPLSPGYDFTPVTCLWFHPCHLAMISYDMKKTVKIGFWDAASLTWVMGLCQFISKFILINIPSVMRVYVREFKIFLRTFLVQSVISSQPLDNLAIKKGKNPAFWTSVLLIFP